MDCQGKLMLISKVTAFLDMNPTMLDVCLAWKLILLTQMDKSHGKVKVADEVLRILRKYLANSTYSELHLSLIHI